MALLQPEIRQDAAPPPYSVTFPVSNPNDPKDSMAINAFLERRKVRVTLTGDLTATHKDNGGTRTTTPSGYTTDCTGRIRVRYAGNGGEYAPVCSSTNAPFTKDIVVQGQGVVYRDGFGTAGWRCASPNEQQFCWTFSGTQQVTVEVIDYPGRMTAYDGSTEKTTIPAAKSLWFAWTPMPNQSDIPKATYNWWFVTADSGRVIQNAVPYGYEAQWGYVPKSGTMYVKVTINGVEKTLSRYIHVGPATLTLSAAPAKVYAGDTVHFSAEIKPDSTPVSGLRWFWFPEQPVIGLRASATKDPGAAQKALPAAGSLAQTTDSIEIGACAGYRTCDYVVYARGGMRVHAVVAGAAEHAERDVDVRHVKIQLTAKPQRVIEGKRVYFTATASTAGGSPAAVGISEWTWQDASGVSTPPCPAGYPNCDQLVFRSGTMRAIGTVNGSTDTAFVTVSAFDCDTTGIPELDDIEARDSIDAFWRRQRGIGPHGTEAYQTVFQTGDGGMGFYYPPLVPGADACSVRIAGDTLLSAYRGGLLIHPHLTAKGFKPPECLQLSPADSAYLATAPAIDTVIFAKIPGYSPFSIDTLAPSAPDWGYISFNYPRLGSRHAVVSEDSVFVYGPQLKEDSTPNLNGFRNSNAKRFSREDWKRCTQTPIP